MNNTTQNNNSLLSVEFNDKGSTFQISATSYKTFVFVALEILYPTIALFGIVGNCLGLCVIVKVRRVKGLSIYTYLGTLTTFDILYLLIGVFRVVVLYIKYNDEQLYNYIQGYASHIFIYISNVASHTSSSMIIVMSIDRLIALVRPFDVKNTWFSQHPGKIAAFCFAMNILAALPLLFLFNVTWYTNANNITMYVKRASDQRISNLYFFTSTIVNFYIPIILVVFANFGIATAYARILFKRKQTLTTNQNSALNQQKKVTLTVVGITTLYLLLSIPDLSIKLLAYVDPEYSFDGKYAYVYKLFVNIANLMTCVNASSNFIVYILISNQNRQMFNAMFCKCCDRRASANDSSSVSIMDGINSSQNNTVDSNVKF